MEDPTAVSTLVAVGTLILQEGTKFLFGQATEILKLRRERKQAALAGHGSENAIPDALPEPLPDIFEGSLDRLEVDFEALDQVADELVPLRREIADYAEGIADLNPADPTALGKLEAVRRLLEIVYHKRITFRGEQRETSGPLVQGAVDVKEVVGYAAAIRARSIKDGTVTGLARADRVESGGEIVGVEVDSIKRD